MIVAKDTERRTREQIPLIYSLFLLSVWILLCVHCADVEITTYCDCSPLSTTDSVVTFCPNKEYTLIVQCTVKNTLSLEWVSQHFNTASFFFEHTHSLGTELERGDFTFSAINASTSFFSQLRVHTSALRNLTDSTEERQIYVTCKASKNDSEILVIRPAGVEKPRIDHVEFTATNRLMVLWSSNNTEIRHARVVIERGDVSIPSSCLDLTKKKAVFDIVDDTAPYNIKVTEYNKCDQELSSTCSVNPKMSQSAFSPTMFQCPSPPSGAPRLQSTSVLPTTYQFTSSASSIGVNLSPSPSSSSSIGVNLSPSPSSSSSIGVNLSPSPSSSSSGLSQFQGFGVIAIVLALHIVMQQ